MENTQQANVRRLQDTLIIAGDGVIAFGAWALVKTALLPVLFNGEELQQLVFGGDMSLTAMYVLAGVLVCIDLGVRAFVGLSARSEGRGKKRSPLYLAFAAIAALITAFSVVAIALGMSGRLTVLDMVVSIIVETTALAALVTVVYCSIRLRRLNKLTG